MQRFLKKLEIEMPYDPVVQLLGIHTKETRIERDTCTPMFIATLFIIARTWKQPRCPSGKPAASAKRERFQSSHDRKEDKPVA